MTHEPKFCELCGFMDDGTIKANALSIDGRCPFCEQAYQRGREDAEREVLAMDIRRSIHWLADKSGSWTCVPVDTAAAAARGGGRHE